MCPKRRKCLLILGSSRPLFVPPLSTVKLLTPLSQYKYLGTIIDNKLSFEPHTDAVCAKAHQRMHFYRKLRGFKVDPTFMRMFYSCFIESVLTFAFISWFGSATLRNRNRLCGITKTCSKIAGTALNDLPQLHKGRALKKALSILDDPSHPLFSEFKLLPSGRRFAIPRCRTNRFKNSFVPAAIGFLNTM